MRAVILACLLGAAHAGLCSVVVGKSCKVTDCNFLGSSGDSHCVDGQCRCHTGSCAFAGYCMKPKGCDKRTHGTCRLLPCKDSRGWTDCVDGYCDCQADACSVQGKCEKACDYRTGGTCNVFGCSRDRHAKCESPGSDYWGIHSYRCVCKEGDCAAYSGGSYGRCYPGVDYGSSTAMNSTAMNTVKHEKVPPLPSATPGATKLAASFQHPLLALPLVFAYVMFGMGIGFLVIRRTWSRSVTAPESMLG
mmetsp:Transcript_32989/g.57376  ORF Transcript_32989/g.57376 Transcript_32989/m.57376 type:complete len:248 (+) Transcript_32989:82-825(+)